MPDFVDEINPEHADVTFHVYVDASVTYKRDPEEPDERIYRFGLGFSVFRDNEPWLLESQQVEATHPVDKRRRKSLDQERKQYSMQMEFNAAAEALNSLPEGARVIIHTDQHHAAKVMTDLSGWLGSDVSNIRHQPVYGLSINELERAVSRHFHVTVEHIKAKDKLIPRKDRQRHNLAHNLAGLSSGSNKRHGLDYYCRKLFDAFCSENNIRNPFSAPNENPNENMTALEQGERIVDTSTTGEDLSNEDALDNPPFNPYGIIKNDPEPQ